MPRAACIAALAAALAACSSAPEKKVASADSPLLAVFPFANQSLNVDAPGKVRSALFRELEDRGFRLVSTATVDAALLGLGIREGGQLGAVDFEKLKAAVPADRYCYGTLLDWNFKSAVALSQRKVELELRLVDAAGKELFKEVGLGITSKAGVDAAGDLVLNVMGKVGKAVKDSSKKLLPGETLKKTADMTDEVADVELKAETREAIRRLLERFPR